MLSGSESQPQQEAERAPVVQRIRNLSEIRRGQAEARFGELRSVGEIDRFRPDGHVPIPHMVQVRPNEAFKLAILPFRKVLRPRLPAISMGARMKRNAERGSNRTEASGFPMVRLRTEGSTTYGRSPLLPSTLPKPGPSEPASTVKGVPLFSSNTEVRSQLR